MYALLIQDLYANDILLTKAFDSRQKCSFHTRRKRSKTSWQVHLPRKQCLINRKGHRHTANEGMDSYR